MKINIFKRQKSTSLMPLRIKDISEAPKTAEPDDSEVAAQAILEIMLEKASKRKWKKPTRKGQEDKEKKRCKDKNNAAYYQHLSEHIREAYHAARQRALRFLCYCEQQLSNPNLPAYGHGSIALLETELYKRLDIVEREGGDMKKRWQHCLAEVTLRLMNSPLPDDKKPGDGTTGKEKDNT